MRPVPRDYQRFVAHWACLSVSQPVGYVRAFPTGDAEFSILGMKAWDEQPYVTFRTFRAR